MSGINSSIFSDSTSDPQKLPQAKILEIHREYSGYFCIDKARIVQPGITGSASQIVTRYVLERGDSVAVILHDPILRQMVLVRQYRFPASLRNGNGWLLEIPAGSLKPGVDPKEAVRREIEEEVGVVVEEVRQIGSFYLSPGGLSERCYLFEAKVDSSHLHGKTCGEPGTDEDVRVEVYTLDEALHMIANASIIDAKTIIAVQMAALGSLPGWPGNPGRTD